MHFSHFVKNILPAGRISLVLSDDDSCITPITSGGIDELSGIFEVILIDDVNPEFVIRDH